MPREGVGAEGEEEEEEEEEELQDLTGSWWRWMGGGGPWQQSGTLEPTQGSVGTPQWDSMTSVQRGGEEGVDEALYHGGSEVQ